MTTRKLTHGQKLLVGLVLALALAASAMGMRAHAAPTLAMPTPEPGQGVLILRNETGIEVAGVELAYSVEPSSHGAVYAYSAYQPGEVLQCNGCVWVVLTLAPGEELRVLANQPYASGQLISAKWHLEARSLLQAIWKVSRCAVL